MPTVGPAGRGAVGSALMDDRTVPRCRVRVLNCEVHDAPTRGGRAVPDRPEVRHCASCGRVITWRRAWARDWDEVRWCSKACRRRGLRPGDLALEQAIRELLVERGGSADPEEVANSGVHLGGWTPAERREAVRRAVRRMAAAGEIEVRQAGRRVDPSTARGALQVRLLREGDPRPGWRTD